MWWKKNKWKLISSVLILAGLAAVFYYGGDAPGARGWTVKSDEITATAEPTAAPEAQPEVIETAQPFFTNAPETSAPSTDAAKEPEPTETHSPMETPLPSPNAAEETKPPEETPELTMEIDPETGKDQYMTDQCKPLSTEPEDVTIGGNAYTCTISISCATILNNMNLCDPEKRELVPENGWILEPTVVTFYEGESVFKVLQRTCEQNKIHMEFNNTPIYNSAYIEGINNLYEFDVGELSGWMYKVNDWFPNYGCSRYGLKDGDVICLVYTCDRGYDVGGANDVG